MEKEIKTINETEYVDEEGRVIKVGNPLRVPNGPPRSL